MRHVTRIFAVALAVSGGACDNDNGQVGIATVPPPDMATPAPTAQVRVAHLSPDAGSVDVCLSVRGANAFMGPVLRGAGATGGLAYGQVTRYLPVMAAAYDVRVISASATTCDNPLFEVTTLPALPAGASVTIAAVGFVQPPAGNGNKFSLQAYIDDTTTSSSTIALRFIHASPDTPAVDVGLGSGASFTPVFTNVSFTQVGRSTTPPSDANGYVAVPAPTTPPTLSARATGTATDALTVTLPAAPPAGTVATVFAIGDLTGTPKPLQALVCVDNAAPMGLLSVCSRLP